MHLTRPLKRTRARVIATFVVVVAMVAPVSPTAAAAGGHLLYARQESLMSVPARGGTPQKLARIPAGTLDLASSHDGKRIVLISNRKLHANRGSVRSIHLFRPGHHLRLVRRFHSTAPLDIAISPNGQWIAFGQQSEIWLMRASGGEIRQVTDGPSFAWDPAFTPDGQSLIFNRDARTGPSYGPQLFRQSLSGGPEAQLSDDEGRRPAVSSTGLLLYTRPGNGPIDSRLIVMRLDGGGRHAIGRYDSPFADLSATFSPDGGSIAYLRSWKKNGSPVNFRYSIHTMAVDGSEHRKVIGELGSSARHAPFGGPAPAGPVWVPW